MNSKTTLILAGLTAAAFIAWLAVQPAAENLAVRERPFEWRESLFQSITIRPAGKPEILLKRNTEAIEGSLWRVATIDKPADDARIAEMIAGLRRLGRDQAIKPGSAAHTPGVYGLEPAQVAVEIAAGGEKRTVKFGNPSVNSPDVRFFMIEGEPEIYMGPTDAAPPFLREIADLRSRSVLTFNAAAVMAVEVGHRIMRPVIGPDGKPVKGADDKPVLKSEFERLKFEFRDQAAAGKKGWYLVEVNGEGRDDRAEDIKLSHLISGLRGLTAEEFVPLASPTEHGLDAPDLVATLHVLQPPSDQTKPVFVEISRTEEKGARKLAYVRVDRATEAGVVNGQIAERLPRERKQFLSPDLIDFDPGAIASVELVTSTGHKVRIAKEERDEMRGTQTFKVVNWNVAEPVDFPAEPNAPYDFVSWLVKITVSDFLGVQPDLAPFGLDNPTITLTLKLKHKGGETEDRVYKFGCPGMSEIAYLLKPGSKEVYQVSKDIWRKLDRTDLNFRQLTIFNIQRSQIVGVSFDYDKDILSANPTRYAVRRGDGGAWEFEDADLRKQGLKVDPERMNLLLGALNYIRAEGFLSRNPRIAAEYGLDAPKSQGRLVIRYADPNNPGKSTERVFRLSKSYAEPTGRARLYYSKIEPAPGETSPSSDATIVFRIKTEVVELLRQGVIYEKAADPGHRHDDKKD